MSRATSGLNCLVGVDKPLGITSHDVVARVRRALGERRVGHAGTLDPAASGVLVLGIGRATRLLGHLTLDEKSYEALIAFGTQTTTDDAEGEVVRSCAVPEELWSEDVARATVAGLVGECEQVPPAYSAISVDGKRAYALARSGEQVELAARRVHVYEAELLGVERGVRRADADGVDADGGADGAGAGVGDVPVWRVRLRVSKGTYVRSIARDLGVSLGTAAHLGGLRRTSSGCVDCVDCLSLEELEQGGAEALRARMLDPARALGLPVRLLAADEFADVATGRRIAAGQVLDLSGEGMAALRQPRRGERVSLVLGSRFFGIWSERGGRLASEVNFPEGVDGVRA